MRKIFIMGIVCVMGIGLVFAQDLTPKEEQELEQLSKKLVRMKKTMDKFVNDMTSAYPEQEKALMGEFGVDVKVDVVEKEKEIIVTADLPGMDKDKITVTLENNKMLTIAGSREVLKEETGPNVVKRERMEGQFKRVLELPAECKPDGIEATYKNGVLEITIPKKEPSKQQAVKVKIQ